MIGKNKVKMLHETIIQLADISSYMVDFFDQQLFIWNMHDARWHNVCYYNSNSIFALSTI